MPSERQKQEQRKYLTENSVHPEDSGDIKEFVGSFYQYEVASSFFPERSSIITAYLDSRFKAVGNE